MDDIIFVIILLGLSQVEMTLLSKYALLTMLDFDKFGTGFSLKIYGLEIGHRL